MAPILLQDKGQLGISCGVKEMSAWKLEIVSSVTGLCDLFTVTRKQLGLSQAISGDVRVSLVGTVLAGEVENVVGVLLDEERHRRRRRLAANWVLVSGKRELLTGHDCSAVLGSTRPPRDLFL